MSCDDYCCNHGCNQGRNCVARKTPAAGRATEFQAATDRQAAQKAAPDDDSNEYGGVDEFVLDGIAVALIVWLVAFVFAPALAGYLTHMK